jgi:hypothetical protein
MAMSTWFALGVLCLLYVAFAMWAVSQVFPRTRAATPRFDPDKQLEGPKT